MNNLSFYGIKAGEVTAPVSSMYKHFVMELLDFAFNSYDEKPYIAISASLRIMFTHDDAFKKLDEKLQLEIMSMLHLNYELAYELVRGVPYAEDFAKYSVATNVEVNVEPEKNIGLSLVK